MAAGGHKEVATTRGAATGVERGRRSAGFTLVEMLVTVAVLAVLLNVAAPSFATAMQDVRLVAEYNQLASVLRQARSEAIKRSRTVIICARASDSSCGADWNNGWLVYVEDPATSLGTVDGTDEVLRAHTLGDSISRLKAAAIVRPDDMAARSDIRFTPRGRTDWTLGTVVLCDERGVDEARALIVNGAGLFRKAETDSGSDGVVTDAAGDAVTCT